MLLLFYQGSYQAPFSDVPTIAAGFIHRKRRAKEVCTDPILPELVARQETVATRTAKVSTTIARAEAKAWTQLAEEGGARIAKAAQATLVRNRAALAALQREATVLQTRIAERVAAIERIATEECDLIFVFHLMAEV